MTEKHETHRREEDQTMIANRRLEDQIMVDDRRAYDRRMEDCEPNVWKFVSVIGIPITAILTWVFVAGGIVQDVKNHTEEIKVIKTNYELLDARVRSTELGITRIDVQYRNICDTLVEIKEELKKK